MNEDQPLVSVITPMFNAERYIAQTITSCLNQTYKNWELLIVDDCSTDQSVAIAKQFTDSRIRLLQMSKNSGPGAARNFGLLQSQGEWITVLDADDAFRENRISSFVELGLELGEKKVLYDMPVEWNGSIEISPEFLQSPNEICVDQASDVVLENWIKTIGYSTPFFNRALLGDNICYPEDIRGPEDTVFFVRLCALNNAGIIEVNTKSYIYRRLEGSLSNRGLLQLKEIGRSIEIMRPISSTRPEITAALDTLERRNNVNLVAVQLRLHYRNKEFTQILKILIKNLDLAHLLFGKLFVSIRYQTQSRYL